MILVVWRSAAEAAAFKSAALVQSPCTAHGVSGAASKVASSLLPGFMYTFVSKSLSQKSKRDFVTFTRACKYAVSLECCFPHTKTSPGEPKCCFT